MELINPCPSLRPPLRPSSPAVDLVARLDVALDDEGYVRVDAVKRETSAPGIYAAGDMTTRKQGAIYAAASGTQAAAAINVDLAVGSAVTGVQ